MRNYRIVICVVLGVLQGVSAIAVSANANGSQKIPSLQVAANGIPPDSGQWLPGAYQQLFGRKGSGTLQKLPVSTGPVDNTGSSNDNSSNDDDSSNDQDKPPQSGGDWNLAEGDGIVFTRIPRTTSNIEILGETLGNLDVFDTLPDVTHRLWGFSGPGQLVHLKPDGTLDILYDCLSPTPRPCVPMDSAVSLDGTRIAFSVYRTRSLGKLKPVGFPVAIPNKILVPGNSIPKEGHFPAGMGAQIFIADLSTGKLTAWPHTPGTWDTGPVWLPNGRIMFTSTRAEDRASVLRFSQDPQPVLQLWIADANGENAIRVGPHERDSAMHPYLHSKTGRVMYSSWQIDNMLPYRTSNGLGVLFGTKDNFWWIMSVDRRGGGLEAELGAHTKQTTIGHTLKAVHFLGERANGDLCVTNYYRGNNSGAGSILCWPVEPGNVEGPGPKQASSQAATFEPRGLYMAVDGDDSDTPAEEDGRVRDPEGLPDGNLLFTWLQGYCYHGGFQGFKEYVQKRRLGCDAGIYRTTRIPAKPATDAEMVIDSPDWQEFMPRLVHPRHIATPTLKTASSGQCLLGGASMVAEVRTHGGEGKFPDRTPCGLQGCSAHGIDLSEITKIRFWEVIPFKRSGRSDFHGSQGVETRILGDVPLEADGSFLVSLPCDMPYEMAGVDSEGRTIAQDQVVQSIRPGEFRTCSGCHLHSTNQGPKFEDSLAAKSPPVVLDKPSRPEWEWSRDIFPVLKKNCASCHSGNHAPNNLTFDRPGTGKGSTYWQLTENIDTQRLPNPPPVQVTFRGGSPPGRMDRPWLSKYIHMLFARESLLYWKAAGQRLDGRTDADRPDDINFGPAHPWTLNEKDLSMLAEWIESGVYAK